MGKILGRQKVKVLCSVEVINVAFVNIHTITMDILMGRIGCSGISVQNAGLRQEQRQHTLKTQTAVH